MGVSQHTLDTVLHEQFGLTEFRPGQKAMIQALVAGQDVVGVLPTGAGKSLLYQLPAQVLSGLTVVVTPLLALMQDQVDSIEDRGMDVGVVNSMLSPHQMHDELGQVRRGEA